MIVKTTYKQLDGIGRPDVFIKLEFMQLANSFKARGIINLLKNIPNPDGLVTFTTGNQGIAIAMIARKLGIGSVVVSFNKLNPYKKKMIEQYGASLEFIENTELEAATSYAKSLAARLNYLFIPLYGNSCLLDGYSQIATEICHDFSGDLTMFFPAGSGSLLLANAIKAREINPGNKIVGVEPQVFQRFNTEKKYKSQYLSIADSLSIPDIPECNLDLLQLTEKIVPVSEEETINSMRIILKESGHITEPGGAVSLAAALKERKNSRKKIAVITGSNISDEQFYIITKMKKI